MLAVFSHPSLPTYQVPLKLSTLCKEAHLKHPGSAAVHVSTMALKGFLAKASKEDILQLSTELCTTILQQVQQSGLLQHLADMMTTAAEGLAGLQLVCCLLQWRCKRWQGPCGGVHPWACKPKLKFQSINQLVPALVL